MVELIVIVKPFRAEAVLAELAQFGVSECVVREVKGYGRQKGYLDRYRGSEYSTAYLPKVEIACWVPANKRDELSERIARIARTGRIGDGKIFVVPTAWPAIDIE